MNTVNDLSEANTLSIENEKRRLNCEECPFIY